MPRLDDLVSLEAGLFKEDAGVHDPAVDTERPASSAATTSPG